MVSLSPCLPVSLSSFHFMRLTLGQVRATRIPGILGLCSTSSALAGYVNEAQQRLLPLAKWWNTYQRIGICVADGNITWPRCVATVESVAICNTPLMIRNEWFEFIENGIGIQQRDQIPAGANGGCGACGTLQLFDRGTSCLFAEVSGTKKLRVYIDNPSDANKRMLIKAKDGNGDKIYSLDAGAPVEGFYIVFAAGPVLTTQLVSEIYGVVKDDTLGNVRVYQYDPADTTQSLILNAEPLEGTPNYRRSLLSGAAALASGHLASTHCGAGTERVVAEVKLEFIPALRDTDFLIIDWVPALKEMCQSIFYGENDSLDAKKKATFHEARAVAALDDELKHYVGDGVTAPIEFESATWGNRMATIY